MTNYDECIERYRREQAAWARANTLNKAPVFDALATAGLTSLTVEFDGEGDSGQIDELRALAGSEHVHLPSMPVVTHTVAADRETLTTREQTLRVAIEDLCYACLEEKHDGWEINDGAYRRVPIRRRRSDDRAGVQRPLHRCHDRHRHLLGRAVMAHPYHHALSSARKWGEEPEDYLRIHDWFDESKLISADF